MLASVQQQFPEDSEIYNMIGNALFAGHKYDEAAEAFELDVRFDPASSTKQASLGQTYLAIGKPDLAERHLENAMELDPLNLSAAALLIKIYDKDGKTAKADELSKRLAKLIEKRPAGE
jgi:tetratricopeptide (TPR) repeat protein